MTVTVKRAQPRPVVDRVTIVLELDEARVLKLLTSYRSRIMDILDERISDDGEVPFITTAYANDALKRMWTALHAADIHWSTR